MTLVVVDGNNILHKCMHVGEFEKIGSNGMNVGGVYGVVSMIRSSLDRFRGSKCIVAWDAGYVFRSSLFPDYKKNRLEFSSEKEMEEAEDHRRVVEYNKRLLMNILSRLGVLCITVDGVEADDVIYMVVKLCDRPIMIVSEDLDLAQLVSEGVSLYRPSKSEIVDIDTFEDKMGVPIEFFLLRKALVGDPSDGIPGVKQVGEKRSLSVLPLFSSSSGDFDRFFEECGKSRSAPIRRISESRDLVRRNLRLMDLTMHPWDNGSIELLKNDIECHRAKHSRDLDTVHDMFRSLGFRDLLLRFSSWVQPFLFLVR